MRVDYKLDISFVKIQHGKYKHTMNKTNLYFVKFPNYAFIHLKGEVQNFSVSDKFTKING